MANTLPSTNPETRWTPGARLVLGAALVFIALNLAQVAYRFTIPSIGWAGPDPDEEDLVAIVFKLEVNAVGAPSKLQPGDVVMAIGEVPAGAILDNFPASLNVPENWDIGETIALTVERDGRTLVVDAPVVHWKPAAWVKTELTDFQSLWGWLTSLLLFSVSLFTFLKRPGSLAARFLFAFGLANLSITLSYSVPDPLAFYLDVFAGYAKVIFGNIIFAYLLGPSFLGFALTFPKPKDFIRRQPRWLLVPYLVGSTTIVLLLTAPDLAVIGFLFTFVMLLLGVAGLVHAGITQRDAVSRAQLRWAVGGVAAGVAVFLLNFATFQPAYREVIQTIANLGFPIVGLSLAVAILRYRLFDIDVIIRRTLQYALLTGLLALVYFGGVIVLERVLGPLTGSSNTPLVTVITTLAIAALFNPLRLRIQEFIDRRFYRRKYDAELALARFAAAARDEVDLEHLSAAILDAVAETLQPEVASLWVRPLQK